MKPQFPVKEGLWEIVGGEPCLLGSECASCGEIFFPKKDKAYCPRCQSRSLKDRRLGREGTVSTFTVVYQPPAGGFYKGPVPYAYGVVCLPEGVNVQTLFTGCDLEKIETGQKMRLVVERLCDDEAVEIVTYKFTPADAIIGTGGGDQGEP